VQPFGLRSSQGSFESGLRSGLIRAGGQQPGCLNRDFNVIGAIVDKLCVADGIFLGWIERRKSVKADRSKRQISVSLFSLTELNFGGTIGNKDLHLLQTVNRDLR